MTADIPDGRLRDLLLVEGFPEGRDPAEAYIARRAPHARATAREVVDAVAALLTSGDGRASTFAWHRLRTVHTPTVRAALEGRYPPPLVARMLAAVRGVLKECVRLGLMPSDEYGRVRVLLTPGSAAPAGRVASRRELRSVLETITDDPSPSTDQNGTLRALLHGRYGQVPEVPPTSGVDTRRRAERRAAAAQLGLRYVTRAEALVHTLHEADRCLRQWTLCAFLEMLRRALDLWSAEYMDRVRVPGGSAGGRETLRGRLRRIADTNPSCQPAIEAVASFLDLVDSPPEERVPSFCPVGSTVVPGSLAATRLQAVHRDLYEQVAALVAATLPDVIV